MLISVINLRHIKLWTKDIKIWLCFLQLVHTKSVEDYYKKIAEYLNEKNQTETV